MYVFITHSYFNKINYELISDKNNYTILYKLINYVPCTPILLNYFLYIV